MALEEFAEQEHLKREIAKTLRSFTNTSLPTTAEGVIKLDRADHFGIVDLLERSWAKADHGRHPAR